MNFNHNDSYRVTSEDAIKFKHYMGTDAADFKRTMPGFPMYYDTDFNYAKDRDYWLKVILSMGLVSYGYKKW